MTPSTVPAAPQIHGEVQVQLAAKLADISQVINDASLGTPEQQQAAKSEAISYHQELEAILRAAAAQVNEFDDQQDLRQAALLLSQQLQERDDQLRAVTAECSALKAAASAREAAAAQKLAKLRQQHAQEIAQRDRAAAAAEKDAFGLAQRASALEAELQQVRTDAEASQQQAQQRTHELQSELLAARSEFGKSALDSKTAMTELRAQHAEAMAALESRSVASAAEAEAKLAASREEETAHSIVTFEAEKRQWACHSEDFVAGVASVFQQAFAELSAIKAAYPTLVRQEEGAQPGADRAALDTLRTGGFATSEALRAALDAGSTALQSRLADVREALSLALQSQLLQAENAQEVQAATKSLEQLTTAHKELQLQCEQQQAQSEQQQTAFDVRLSELQDTEAASTAAVQVAQAEAAASATRCAALQDRLDILQQQCDALHFNCQRQLEELAASAETSALAQRQMAALQQEHADLQRQHNEAVAAASARVFQVEDDLKDAQQQIAVLERAAKQTAAAHAAELQQTTNDWKAELVTQQQRSLAELEHNAAASEARRQLLEQEWSQRLERQILNNCDAMEAKLQVLAAQHQAQIAAAEAAAETLRDGAATAQRLAAEQLVAVQDQCAALQQQLDNQSRAMVELREVSAHQAADAAALAAERLEQALMEQRLQLQSDYDRRLLENEAAAADALQQALDAAAEHRRMLMAQAETERRQIEDAHAMAVDDLRRDHSAELQRQADAHAGLCQELHARAEATAAAVAKMSSDAAASQQAAAQAAAHAAAAREAQLQGALTRVSADFRAETAALEEAASRERRSHQHLLAAALLDAEQKLASALAAATEAQEEAIQKQAATHAEQLAALAAEHAAAVQRFEQRLTEQRAGQQADQAAWAEAQRRLEQAVADANVQLEVAKQQAQDALGQLAAEHADALAVAFDELSAQQAAAEARAAAAAARAAAEVDCVREEAALEKQALSARVAALEREQSERPPRPEDVAQLAEVRAVVQEQEARAQAAEVALYSLRKEVLLHSDANRGGGIKPAGLSEVRSKLGQTLAAQSGVMAWMRDTPPGNSIRASKAKGSPTKAPARKLS